MRILMLPWLAHGHIFPFLELSKRLVSDRSDDITVFFCSTPVNLTSVRQSLSRTSHHATTSRIHLVELNLPCTLPDLPPHLHTTKHLPPHLMPVLKTAFDLSSRAFADALSRLHPDLVVYDFLQPWAPSVALSLGIPAVQFYCSSAAMFICSLGFLTGRGAGSLPASFPELHLFDHELPGFVRLFERTANGVRDGERVKRCNEKSSGVVLIKTFREIEAKYIDYLSVQLGKKIVPVGPLVEEHDCDKDDGKRSEIAGWLDRKGKRSTVFVSFGSEYFLSPEEITEIAHGLEQSWVNFVWVIRFHGGTEQQDALPRGFLERVGDRGYIAEEWAPQVEILSHPSTGGFLSHCGWSSVMEAMSFGVPIIAMPMHLDQPINARLVAEGVGNAVEVRRDGNGKVRREEVARTVRNVMVEKDGERVRRRAKELRDVMAVRRESGKEDVEMDEVVEELLQVCGKANLVEGENNNHTVLVPN